MTEARPKPLIGALVGLLFGLVSMALLTVLGVLPPDRLPLFGIVAVAVVVVSALLTQRMALAQGRLITVIVIGALLGGVALTGIPEFSRGGSTTAGCMAAATSSLESEPVTASETSALDPFRVTPTDTVEWTTETEGAVTEADAQASLLVGGFAIPLRDATFTEAPELTSWSGQSSVESQLDPIRDASGMSLTGTYHLAATVQTDAGECRGDAYVRVEPAGAFDGLLLILLWAVFGVLLGLIVGLAIAVRWSIRDSDATLAMVGTSAIPGSTSTSPPSQPRRAAPSENRRPEGDRSDGTGTDAQGASGEAARRRDGASDADAARDGGRAGRSGGGSATADKADARTAGASAPEREAVGPQGAEPQADRPEASAPVDPVGDDALARSPYAPVTPAEPSAADADPAATDGDGSAVGADTPATDGGFTPEGQGTAPAHEPASVPQPGAVDGDEPRDHVADEHEASGDHATSDDARDGASSGADAHGDESSGAEASGGEATGAEADDGEANSPDANGADVDGERPDDEEQPRGT